MRPSKKIRAWFQTGILAGAGLVMVIGQAHAQQEPGTRVPFIAEALSIELGEPTALAVKRLTSQYFRSGYVPNLKIDDSLPEYTRQRGAEYTFRLKSDSNTTLTIQSWDGRVARIYLMGHLPAPGHDDATDVEALRASGAVPQGMSTRSPGLMTLRSPDVTVYSMALGSTQIGRGGLFTVDKIDNMHSRHYQEWLNAHRFDKSL